ncbi:PP2C family protein-serine/threonine phosphatase [Pseudoalteromonas sp. T1lg75]|uniref:PP2C family protein-serine/threonine phosphatase n=1 Tax=Pseudoalteromonas sp. T1lg75 TaxID=2077102 RepID=UPI000CF61366|nr:protein phosphatase 2C domain-containing protein [Pseudoalteromonas sp. T1lg75]
MDKGMGLTSFAQSHCGVIRSKNEDAFLALPEQRVWVVADGMGAHSKGDYASSQVIEIVRQHLHNKAQSTPLHRTLINAFEDANKQLFHHSQQLMQGKTMGSTAVALVLDGTDFYFIWVGDSRGYLFRNNRLEQQTRDHSRVNVLLDSGVITSAQAASHPLQHEVARAIGVKHDVQVEVVHGTWQTDDIFLLCSDGLTQKLSDFEIEVSLATANLQAAGQALMHSALTRGAGDNVTCILVK